VSKSDYAITIINNQEILGYPKKLFQLGDYTLYKMSLKHAVREMRETRLSIPFQTGLKLMSFQM
jgi:hypothetical protein